MSTRTTTAAERIDVLLQQAREFYALDLMGEAIARLRHTLSLCEKEAGATTDPHTLAEIETRRGHAVEMLERLGGPTLPMPHEHETT